MSGPNAVALAPGAQSAALRPRDAAEKAAAAFAANVRRARNARGWTQDDLAIAAGVGRGTVINVELRRCGVTLEIAAMIAAALGTTVGALAGERESKAS